MYRLKFLTEYILNKERLLKVLPYQMKHFTESELNQRYSSYFPYKVKSLRDVLKVADLENDIVSVDTDVLSAVKTDTEAIIGS